MPTTRSTGRGFAGMNKEKQREIASLGGRAAHASGNAHEWTSAEAREAGRRGGIAAHQQKGTRPATPPSATDEKADKADRAANAAEFDDDRNPRYSPTPEPQRTEPERPEERKLSPEAVEENVPTYDEKSRRERGRSEMSSEGDYR